MPSLPNFVVGTLVCAGSSVSAGRTLTFERGPASADLPLEHHDLRKTHFIEQVHVTGGAPDAAVITWVTNKTSRGAVRVCPTKRHTSCKDFYPRNEAFSFFTNAPFDDPPLSTCVGSWENATNYKCYYDSGVVHAAHIRDFLLPAQSYTYTFSDDTTHQQFGFTMPPAAGYSQISFAVVGDLGQTGNSSATLDSMYARAVGTKKSVDAVLHVGDLSYADGYGPRWDSYARMGQKLWANTVTSYTGGNHEVSVSGENWAQYRVRYPNDYDLSHSDSFLWYSYNAGPTHVISLCSYAGFLPGSLQYEWLEDDLKSIDRTATPWVVAMWHTPWYTSNAHHPRSEGAAMMDAMEELIHDKVDIVFNGHVHAYERSHTVYRNKTTTPAQGITYITIGDGGNREGYAVPWVDPQPSWSAVREFAYGYGTFQVHNHSAATWQWLRNDEPGTVADEFVFSK